MPETLTTEDGQALDIDAAEVQFAAAMAAPVDTPDLPAPPRIDPDAPYGRTKEGKPKKGPGGRPPKDSKHDRPRTATQTPAVPADRKQTWTETLSGVGQMGAMLCLSTGQRTGSVAWQADAVAIVHATPGIVAAVVDLAESNAAIARLLDSLCTVGPYGALVMAVMPLVGQLASNHGHPAGRMLGGKPPEELLEGNADGVAPHPA